MYVGLPSERTSTTSSSSAFGTSMRPLIASSQSVVPSSGMRMRIGALVLVGRALVDEPPRLVLGALHDVELERRLAVPLDPEPLERSLDLLHGLLDLAARIRVLDPQETLARRDRGRTAS